MTSTATLDNFIQTEDETSVIIQEEWVQNFGGAEMIVGIVWVAKLFSVITHVVSSYVNLSEQTKVFT